MKKWIQSQALQKTYWKPTESLIAVTSYIDAFASSLRAEEKLSSTQALWQSVTTTTPNNHLLERMKNSYYPC